MQLNAFSPGFMQHNTKQKKYSKIQMGVRIPKMS